MLVWVNAYISKMAEPVNVGSPLATGVARREKGGETVQLIDHPDRSAAVAELHLRPMPPLYPPCDLIQLVRLPAAGERDFIRAAVAARSGREFASDTRHAAGRIEGCDWSWEEHSEAATMTLVLPLGGPSSVRDQLVGWIADMPGGIIRATRIRILATDEDACRELENAAFEPGELVGGRIGSLLFWSDFRVRLDEGLGLAIIAANATPAPDLGRLVRQFQELGNYRNLALRGLTEVRRHSATLAAIEEELARTSAELGDCEADQRTLESLMGLSAQCQALRTLVSYRLGATAAYGQVVIDRLHALAPDKIAGLQTLSEFTERRLLPALRTCEAFGRRLEGAAMGVERATTMLRTRIELIVQQQNLALLRSVDRSAARQVAMQRLVEGLSAVALSYYAISLIEMMARSAQAHGLILLDSGTLGALAVVPLLLTIALALRARSRRIDRGLDDAEQTGSVP